MTPPSKHEITRHVVWVSENEHKALKSMPILGLTSPCLWHNLPHMADTDWVNRLYFGDNLSVMREHVADKSIDLIYLDPPFNSNADYNVLFEDESGRAAPSQMLAYEDTWHWGYESELALNHLLSDRSSCPEAGKLLDSLIHALGTNQMTAYLAMMAVRLCEMRRVLKETGSIYLHCDPTASHYLKIMMDAIFGAERYRNEIIWHYRASALTSAENVFPRKHDTLLFYKKGSQWTFHKPRQDDVSEQMMQRWGKYLEDDGKTVLYGSIKHENAEEERSRRRIRRRIGRDPRDGDVAFEIEPSRVRSVWTDIPEVRQSHTYKEWRGFETQKPLKLLTRIIETSSNPGDVVLDPFCGCGTAIQAAQATNREWIGIDITHLAIGLVESRLAEVGVTPKVVGAPQDMGAAQDLARRDPFQFESWAVTRLDGFRPNRVQRGDGGVDGRMSFPKPNGPGRRKSDTGVAIAQVKSGRWSVQDVRALIGAMEDPSTSADLGVLVVMEPPGTRSQAPATAARAGITQIGRHSYPRVQIWSIADFFAGRFPDLPIAFGRESRTML